MESDVAEMKDEIASALFANIPVGVGSKSLVATTRQELDEVLTRGIDWSVEKVRQCAGLHFIRASLSVAPVGCEDQFAGIRVKSSACTISQRIHVEVHTKLDCILR